jgi:hypothetical protein
VLVWTSTPSGLQCHWVATRKDSGEKGKGNSEVTRRHLRAGAAPRCRSAG